MRWFAAVVVGAMFYVQTIAGYADEVPFEPPPSIKMGAPPCVVKELIYQLEGRQTPECHASTIEETPDGLVAAWFGGTEEGDTDVGIWVARHDGARWSTPVEVVDGSEGESEEFPCWNPVLFQPRQGPLSALL